MALAPILNSLPARSEYTFSREKYEKVPHQGVWSMQLSLVQLNPGLLEENSEFVDGYFGPRTEEAVMRYQRARNLGADGVAGPKTQKRIVWGWKGKVEDELSGLPVGLLDGFCEGEGGWLLAPVNWWVAGGVDTGAVQNRVYDLRGKGASWPLSNGVPTSDLLQVVRFDPDMVARALDAYGRLLDLGKTLKVDRDYFYNRRATGSYRPSYRNNQRSWEYASLKHNWPWAANELSMGNQLPNKDANWIPQSIRNQGYTTYADWAEFYIGSVTRFVTSWS